MTYERLIIAVDNEAPHLSDIAYKLLWRLIALAIHRGTPEVDASIRWLSAALSLSKESVATATRELGKVIKITPRAGQGTTFSLPPDWFPPQRTLFAEDRLGGNIDECPNPQDTSVLFPRTPLSWNPGHQCPNPQDTCPGIQDTSVLIPRTPVLESRTQCPNPQDTSAVRTIRNAGARVDRSIDPDSAGEQLILHIDRALRTVEILPDQQEDAEILRDTLIEYRHTLADGAGYNTTPDGTVLARILAIAPVDELCGVLRKLLYEQVRPGRQDMWFFTVLFQRIHGASAKLTASRYNAAKSKAHSPNSNPTLFQDDLLKRTASGIRRLA